MTASPGSPEAGKTEAPAAVTWPRGPPRSSGCEADECGAEQRQELHSPEHEPWGGWVTPPRPGEGTMEGHEGRWRRGLGGVREGGRASIYGALTVCGQ